MSDSDEPITREKKPLSEARLAAIERMKEGRRKSLEAKKIQKEEEKAQKKQMKKNIKMRVEEEMNGLSSLPIDDKEFMEDLRKKAVGEDTKVIKFDETKNEVLGPTSAKREEVKDIVGEILEKQPFSSPTEPQSVVKYNEDDVSEKKPRGRPKKKKVVVNNYYEDETSSSEEEIINNYHKKKKKKSKPKPKPKDTSSDEEVSEVDEDDRLDRTITYNPYNDAMAGISFR